MRLYPSDDWSRCEAFCTSALKKRETDAANN
jgi:hypothetical protein